MSCNSWSQHTDARMSGETACACSFVCRKTDCPCEWSSKFKQRNEWRPLRNPTGWPVFMPHCWLVHQFLCHTVDWFISFYATLLTGSSVFMPHCWLVHQFLCHTVDWFISFYAALLTGSSVFMPHYQLADQFLCHTVDWFISFYATLLTGSSVFMPHCWLVHQFLCRTIAWLISFYATLLTGSLVFMPHYQLADQFLCHCQTGSSVFMPHCQSMMVFFLSFFFFLSSIGFRRRHNYHSDYSAATSSIRVFPHHVLLLKGGQGLSDARSNPNVCSALKGKTDVKTFCTADQVSHSSRLPGQWAPRSTNSSCFGKHGQTETGFKTNFLFCNSTFVVENTAKLKPVLKQTAFWWRERTLSLPMWRVDILIGQHTMVSQRDVSFLKHWIYILLMDDDSEHKADASVGVWF